MTTPALPALPTPTATSPLADVQTYLRQHVDEGVECPACTQYAKVYRRKVHSRMARDLFTVAREGGWDARLWVNVGEVVGRTSPDLVKCRYWGLIEAMEGERDDGSSRIGMWRITEAGLRYLRGATIHKYARLYDGRCLNLTGPQVTVKDALGSKFDYDSLMAGV